jgi:hypothetical protein
VSAPSATLADFPAADPPRCMHCIEVLAQGCPVEAYGDYLVVECKKCRLFTPFRLEKKSA